MSTYDYAAQAHARALTRYRAVLRLTPRSEWPTVRRLVIAVDDDSQLATLGAEWRTWTAVLAHVPGLAVALQLVRNHVEDGGAPCPVCAAAGREERAA